MELEVYWTDFSKNELHKIFVYYKKRATNKVAKEIVVGIVNRAKILENFPEIGPIEILLENRIENFRNLVHKNYKLIYWINIKKNRIEISDVFDTRQNPIKMNLKR